MLRRLGIRSKVLAVLAVPMIVLLAVVGYVGYGAVQSAQTASAAETITNAIGTYAPAITALQAERDASVAKSQFLLTDPTVLANARKKTDAAIGAIPRLAGTDTLAFFPQSVLTAFQESDYEHANLAALRAQVDAGGQTSNIQKTFDAAIDADIALAEVVANVIPNRSLAGYLLSFSAIERSNEDFVRERAIGESIMRLHGSSPGTVQLFVTQVSSTELDRTSARAVVADLGQNSLFIPLSFPTPEFTRMRLVLQNGNPSEIAALDKTAWDKGIADQIASMDSVRDKIFADASGIASQASSSARTQAIGTAGIGLLAVGLSLAFALFVARGIVNPLRRLTAAAADVREQLPKLVEEVAVPGEGPGMELVQIPVESRDEVGRLADAFNAVNATTLQVAQEQAALRGSIAEMFINVARRDQVLLNRQLSFIDSLERTEEDPNALANLFRLDHLATRMRRNAESLLVLAGIDSGRRMRDSMPLSDVIRTASSEIEQYDRIQLDLPIDPHMLGFNALGSAHLLAEILENATVFSEPDTQVEVSTGVRGDSVTVTVVDHGLGMSEEEIELANEKIRSVSASDALGAQRLGLFVVGRLAQRLGAGVNISRAQSGTGTTVEVTFPVVLFQATEAMSSGYGLPSPVADHGAAPAAPTIEDAAAAWLSPPVIEDVPPVVEPVDLTALTDGATTLGLPKRRVRDGATVEEPALPPVTQAELRERDESKIVLPALVEPRLAAELAGAVEGWQPDVAAPASSSLPARSRAASPFWQDVPAEQHVEPVVSAPVSPEVRTGLFSGFRRGVDVPPPAPADLVGRPARAGDAAGPEEHAPGFYAADYHANRYHGAGSELRDARHDAEVATEPVHAEPEPTPVLPAFVIPGLVPDDEDDEVYVPGRSWDPVPVARDRSVPSSVEAPHESAVLPTRRAAEPQTAWAPPAVPTGAPLPEQDRQVDDLAEHAWAPEPSSTSAPRWEPLSSPVPPAAPGWPAATGEPAAAAGWPAPPVEAAAAGWPAPTARPVSDVGTAVGPDVTPTPDPVHAVESPWTPRQAWAPEQVDQAWAPEQAWAPTTPSTGAAPLARRDGNTAELDDVVAPSMTAASTFSAAAPLGFEPHLDEARAWSAGEHLDPLNHPAPFEAAPLTSQVDEAVVPHVDELLAPPVSSPLPSRAPATPTAPDFDASTPWTPAPAPTGFATFAPT
ncbi:MAG: HAMP domain-containing sensor histidine kinase, partial [Cellulomonas sp.]